MADMWAWLCMHADNGWQSKQWVLHPLQSGQFDPSQLCSPPCLPHPSSLFACPGTLHAERHCWVKSHLQTTLPCTNPRCEGDHGMNCALPVPLTELAGRGRSTVHHLICSVCACAAA